MLKGLYAIWIQKRRHATLSTEKKRLDCQNLVTSATAFKWTSQPLCRCHCFFIKTYCLAPNTLQSLILPTCLHIES